MLIQNANLTKSELAKAYCLPVPTLSLEDLLAWRKATDEEYFMVRREIFQQQTAFDKKHFKKQTMMVDIDVFALLDMLDAFQTELVRVVQKEQDEMLQKCKNFQFNKCERCCKIDGGYYTDCDHCTNYFDKRKAAWFDGAGITVPSPELGDSPSESSDTY